MYLNTISKVFCTTLNVSIYSGGFRGWRAGAWQLKHPPYRIFNFFFIINYLDFCRHHVELNVLFVNFYQKFFSPQSCTVHR